MTTVPESVHLFRRGRLVLASGPDRSALTPATKGWITNALTYYEKKFDYAAGPGNAIDFIDRRLFSPGPIPGTVVFPLGLRPRIANGLRSRNVLPVLAGGSIVDDLRGTPADYIDWDGLLDNFTIHPDQQECLTKVSSSDGGVIGSPTGSGKTMLMKMICRMYSQAKIHVVTKSATLADEIYTDLVTLIPSVGRMGGGKKQMSRVTVFVADSLHHGMGQADLLLLDELHQLLAPKYVEILGRYTKTRIFGFSATPTGRMDGRDILGEAICGPVLQTMHYQDAVAMGRIVPITVEWLRMTQGPDTSGIRNPAMRDKQAVWQNDIRNRKIADRAIQFSDEEQVMIMVKTIDHAVRLKSLLPGYTLAYAANGMDEGRLKEYVRRGDLPADEPLMTRERLTALRKSFGDGSLKKVISNYVWSTGVNFRHLSVLFRADAAGSEILDGQIPGRICRRVAGTKESALLIDCWDEWDRRLLAKSQSRHRNYRKRGWTQIYSNQPKPAGAAV